MKLVGNVHDPDFLNAVTQELRKDMAQNTEPEKPADCSNGADSIEEEAIPTAQSD